MLPQSFRQLKKERDDSSVSYRCTFNCIGAAVQIQSAITVGAQHVCINGPIVGGKQGAQPTLPTHCVTGGTPGHTRHICAPNTAPGGGTIPPQRAGLPRFTGTVAPGATTVGGLDVASNWQFGPSIIKVTWMVQGNALLTLTTCARAATLSTVSTSRNNSFFIVR